MADTNARAALMRLRDEFDQFFDEDKVRPHAEGSGAYNAACLNHQIRVRSAIDRELAALPADEMSPPFEGDPKDCAFPKADKAAGASEGCPTPIDCASLVHRFGHCAHGRKPQPDERDKTIAEMREKLRQAEEASEYANAYQSDLAAITATMDRLDYPFHPERQDRNDTIGRLGEMWNHLQTEKQRAEKAEAALAKSQRSHEDCEQALDAIRELLPSPSKGENIVECVRFELAEARKAGRLSVRDVLADEVIYSGREIRRMIDRKIERLLAADQHNPPCVDTGGGCVDTLPESCRIPEEQVQALRDAAAVMRAAQETSFAFLRDEPDLYNSDDDTLREFVQWFESPGRHDIQPPVRAAYVLAKQRLAQRGGDDELHRWLRLHRCGFHDDAFFDAREGALSELCRRALGVTGGGRKEVGDE